MNAKSLRKLHDGQKPRTSIPSLDVADLRGVNIGSVGELLLRHAQPLPLSPDVLPELRSRIHAADRQRRRTRRP